MIPEDSDSWPTTGPVPWDTMFSRVRSLPLSCQWFTKRRNLYQNQQNHHFSGHRVLVVVSWLGCKSKCLWHLLAQSGSVFQISNNSFTSSECFQLVQLCKTPHSRTKQICSQACLLLSFPTCLWRRCFCCSWKERSNDHWMSLVFKFRRVILEDLLTGKPSD